MSANLENLQPVAFVGLGQMGQALVCHLADSAIDVIGVDSKGADSTLTKELKIPVVTTVSHLPRNIRSALVCVPAKTDVLNVARAFAAIDFRRLGFFVNLSTIGPRGTSEVQDAVRSIASRPAYVEAPISGGVIRTAQRQSTLILGCENPDVLTQIKPLLTMLVMRTIDAGRPVDAAMAKLVNNLAAIGNTFCTAEALTFGMAAGLDPQFLFETMEAGTASSYILSSTLRRSVLERDLHRGFATRLASKDMSLILQEAKCRGLHLPLLHQVAKQLDEAVDAGYGDFVFTLASTVHRELPFRNPRIGYPEA